MKKAKIMLSVIAIFAVVGGALAFKVKVSHVVFCAPAAEVACSITNTIYTAATLMKAGSTGTITTSFCTTAPNLPCAAIVPVYRLPND
jgi:hypothetical protein